MSQQYDLSLFGLKTEFDKKLLTKVTSIEGKGLSDNNFSNQYKQQIDRLNELHNQNPHVPNTTLSGRFLQSTERAGVYNWVELDSYKHQGLSDAELKLHLSERDRRRLENSVSIDRLREEYYTKGETERQIHDILSIYTEDDGFLETIKKINEALQSSHGGTTLTQYLLDQLDSKVNKVSGKGLSKNDFTNAYKSKLDLLENYTLPPASSATLGGVSIGYGMKVNSRGNLSINESIVATKVDLENAVTKSEYTLPMASADTLGGVKVHPNSDISIDSQGYITTACSKADISGLQTAVANKLDKSNMLTGVKSFAGESSFTIIENTTGKKIRSVLITPNVADAGYYYYTLKDDHTKIFVYNKSESTGKFSFMVIFED